MTHHMLRKSVYFPPWAGLVVGDGPSNLWGCHGRPDHAKMLIGTSVRSSPEVTRDAYQDKSQETNADLAGFRVHVFSG